MFICSHHIVINTKNTWLRIFEKTINIYFAQARIISSLPRKKTISDPIQPFFHTGKTDTPGKLPVINYNEWRFIMPYFVQRNTPPHNIIRTTKTVSPCSGCFLRKNIINLSIYTFTISINIMIRFGFKADSTLLPNKFKTFLYQKTIPVALIHKRHTHTRNRKIFRKKEIRINFTSEKSIIIGQQKMF